MSNPFVCLVVDGILMCILCSIKCAISKSIIESSNSAQEHVDGGVREYALVRKQMRLEGVNVKEHRNDW